MKFKTQLIKDIKYVKSSASYFLLSFILAPIILGLLFGTMYSKMMNKDIKFSPSYICVVYKDDSNYINSVEDFLKASGMNFINIKEKEILEKIPNNSYLLIEENNGSLRIHNYGKTSIEKNIITSMVSEFMNVFYKKSSEKMSFDERRAFIQSYLNSSTTDYTHTRKIQVGKKLNSYQTMIINLFTAMSLFLGVTFASEFIKNREDSVLRRLISMNKNSKEIYINSIASIFIICFIFTLVYLLFAGNIILKMGLPLIPLLISSLLQSLIITSLFAISISLFSRYQTLLNSITPLLMLMMILGGSTFPIDMFDNIIIISKLMPNYNIQKVLHTLAVGGKIDTIIEPIGIILIESTITLLIGMVVFKAGERSLKNVEYSTIKLKKNVKGL